MNSQLWVVILLGAYFALIILLSLSKTRYFSSRTLYLFRILFPSWRFFEDTTEVPILLHRQGNSTETVGRWEASLPPVPRQTFNLILNPKGNLNFACHTLLDQLVNDLEDLPEGELQKSVSFELVQNLVSTKLAATREQFWQFKICAQKQGTDDLEDWLLSPIYESKGIAQK